MLLLHGLHPQDLASRVERAVEKMHPFLGTHGLRLELLQSGEELVRLKLHGNWQDKKLSAKTLKRDIEAAILDAAPDAARVKSRVWSAAGATYGGLRSRAFDPKPQAGAHPHWQNIGENGEQ